MSEIDGLGSALGVRQTLIRNTRSCKRKSSLSSLSSRSGNRPNRISDPLSQEISVKWEIDRDSKTYEGGTDSWMLGFGILYLPLTLKSGCVFNRFPGAAEYSSWRIKRWRFLTSVGYVDI